MDDKMSPGEDHRADGGKPTLSVFTFAEIGSMNAVALLAGFGLGWLVDAQLGTIPIFIFVGLFVGAACGVYATYRRIRRYL
jgi:F0F1-type ATP synthase assembly protein I